MFFGAFPGLNPSILALEFAFLNALSNAFSHFSPSTFITISFKFLLISVFWQELF